jgi:hypothetical protein
MAAHIKCRLIGRKAWRFLTPGDGLNRLRIHAARFATHEAAQMLVEANRDDNPEWEWLIVSAESA